MASKLMPSERLNEQKDIVEKAARGNMLNKYSGIMISGDNVKISKAFSGELKNVHNSVFKKCLGKKNCEHCGVQEPLDRAHTRSKIEIANEVLNDIHPDRTTSFDMKVFMTEFVMRHSKVGVWMLCKKCHQELG